MSKSKRKLRTRAKYERPLVAKNGNPGNQKRARRAFRATGMTPEQLREARGE